MPVTTRGPFSTIRRDPVTNKINFNRYQLGYNSSPPKPMQILAYTGSLSKRTSGSGNPLYFVDAGRNWGSSYNFHSTGGRPPGTTHVVNAAYDELRGKAVGATSALGTLLAEWRQGMGLIGRGLDYLSVLAGGLKRAVRRAEKLLSHRNGARRASRAYAEGWLEFWFGWSPTCNDIWGAIETMEKPLGYGEPLSGSSSTHLYRSFPSSDPTYAGTNWSSRYICKQGAIFTLSNPNVALAAQLGLINPALILWEIVPWSFLIDWVADVGSWLGSFSDFAGCTVSKAYTTFYSHSYDNWVLYRNNPIPTNKSACTIEGYDHIRVGGLTRPIPNFDVSANLGKRLTRAASAVSLLTLTLQGIDPSSRRYLRI